MANSEGPRFRELSTPRTFGVRSIPPSVGDPAQGTAVSKRGFDLLSPPLVLAASYLIVYVFGLIDNLLEQESLWTPLYRARWTIQHYDGVSIPPLVYLALGFALFAFGFGSPLGRELARKLPPPQRSTQRSNTAFVIQAIAFVGTFSILWLYVSSIGYGRYVPEQSTRSWLTNLSLLGELSMLPYAAFAGAAVAPSSASQSTWPRWFFWLVAFPAQLGISIFIETRTRLVVVLLVVVCALHYRRRRLSVWPDSVIVVALLGTTIGIAGWARTPTDERPVAGPGYLWETVMERSSGFEAYTATFDHLDLAPPPDSLVALIASGVVPRFLWPSKPNATAGEEFSYWLGGGASRGLNPTLAGELLLQFGMVGGLIGMLALGVGWRALKDWLQDTSAAWIYWASLPTLLAIEQGFTGPYSILMRFILVGVVLSTLGGQTFRARSQSGLTTVRNSAPSPRSLWNQPRAGH